MQQANEAIASGAKEKAIDLLEQAAKSNPADKQAWVKLAQAHFERKEYPQAINTASEALARDPANQEAKSVLFVASMRLATNTLADIRKENQLSGNSRNEAEVLVRSIRETLGETVLVPSVEGAGDKFAKARKRPQPQTASTGPAAIAPVTASAVKPGPVTNTAKGSSDPFGALR